MQNVTSFQNVVTALDVRKRLGAIMNEAIYRGKSFVVHRAGKPTVAIIPIAQFEQMLREEGEARAVFSEMTEELRDKFADVDEQEVERLVDEAVAEVRTEQQPPQTSA